MIKWINSTMASLQGSKDTNSDSGAPADSEMGPADSISYGQAGAARTVKADNGLPVPKNNPAAQHPRGLRYNPPPLDIQDAPRPGQGPTLELAQGDGGDDKKHILKAGHGLTLALRNKVSVASYWFFDGVDTNPHVHEVQRDEAVDGVRGGVSQTLHYTWDPAQLARMGANFTVVANFTHPSSGVIQSVPFHIERQ